MEEYLVWTQGSPDKAIKIIALNGHAAASVFASRKSVNNGAHIRVTRLRDIEVYQVAVGVHVLPERII